MKTNHYLSDVGDQEIILLQQQFVLFMKFLLA